MMRKLAALLCGLVLVVATVGLTACKRDDGPKVPTTWDGTYKEDGEVVKPQTPKTYVASRADDRPLAYTAYKADGTKVGDYRAMSNAINAAVESGDNAYVTRLNETRKIFYNRPGYATDSDDCFWYYENGTTLHSFWCYDVTSEGTLATLKGSNMTTARTVSKGTKAAQAYFSYDALNQNGAPEAGLDAEYYQLSTTLDAAAFYFPKVERGTTKATYEIDLSNVKITPGYTEGESADPVYAFMGYYMWAPEYVINVGIACDVTTGNWYPYIGTSRDNSASDTVYNVDKNKCVMTSTWKDGAFVPDCPSLTLEMATNRLKDEDGDPYQVNDFIVKMSDGTIYDHRFTDSTTNEYFSQVLDIRNMFVFVAGLDVRNPVSVDKLVDNVDCFNGAKFENLAVTKAEQYVPTTEEFSDDDYAGIHEEDRGKTHNMLMASGGSEMFSMTILNNTFNTTYRAEDGKDVYSFNFDKSAEFPAAEAPVLASEVKKFQDEIDRLNPVTADNVLDYVDLIRAADKLYGEDENGTGTTVSHVKYYNALDFTAYHRAKDILKEVTKLDEPAQAFATAFDKIQPLSKYVMVGWKAAADAKDTSGYLHNDYTAMQKLMADYAKLSEEMREMVLYHINPIAFEDWALFCTELSVALAHENIGADAIKLFAPKVDEKGDERDITPELAMAQIGYWMYAIKNNTKWASNDAVGVMNYDNSYEQSEFIIKCRRYLEELNVPIPTFFKDTLEDLGYETFETNYRALEATIQIGSAWQVATTNMTKKVEITQAQAELLTKYWSKSWVYTEGGMNWNITNASNGMSARLVHTLLYNLAKDTKYTKFDECYNKVRTVLVSHGYTLDENTEVPAKHFPYRVTADKIDAKAKEDYDLSVLTENGRKFMTDWAKVGPLTSYDIKGWKAAADATDTTGFLYNTVKSIPDGLKKLWDSLVAQDKTYLAQFNGFDSVEALEAEITRWNTFATELAALEANDAFKSTVEFTMLDNEGKEIKVTPERTLALIAYWALKIGNGGTWEGTSVNAMDGNNSWFPSVFVVTLVQHFENDLELTIPAGVKDILNKVKYDAFFDAYDSIYQTVALAQAIETGSLTELSALTEAQLAALNKYWVKGYTISSILTWNWNSGHQFEDYYSARVARVVKIAGGSLKADDGTTELKCKDYFKIVADFLTANGYTVNENGWGVTADTIEVPAA